MARTDTNEFVGRNNYRASYNVTPGTHQAVITNYMSTINTTTTTTSSTTAAAPQQQQQQQSFNMGVVRVGRCDRIAMAMTWGGIGDPQYNIINIRSDSIPNNNLFKSLISKRRCLIVAEGFYEWSHKSDESSKIPPSPYYFYPAPSSQPDTSSSSSTCPDVDMSDLDDNNNMMDNTTQPTPSSPTKQMILMAGVFQIKEEQGWRR
ncbi:hypothetical protein SAMD00019534_057240 [Acytostelium subglobosum LB1]|uniref:hypothetical protein n=1 Tax=Acytostelium subglobosum LB1 TaxID=1410327 RepID=UPI0006447F0A|nr:hypothetical protein SAMD00019534_057240 [Acytostelium subglobosum LB1]GAM22549.1 hypothetical protein SAMD00019534_057240 [Acytostelium subglobosum LB1]|eukprot:XP_012754669.1 hypothetical protein SAMD00019534_057240 [Acytostelium subglobosum LB1]